MAADKHFTYKDAGVDVDAGNEAVRLLKERLKSIHHPLVLEGIGGFGGLMRVPPINDAVLVAGTDGAGTKVMLAREMGVYGTIGIDAVAMSVNDVSACGAVPLFFLDYLVMGKIEPQKVADIVAGVDEGCLLAQCVLLGGETAEHPGHFTDDEAFDLAGFAVGIASRSELWGPARVEPGDALVGIASNGLHANGYSLVRALLSERHIALDEPFPGGEAAAGAAGRGGGRQNGSGGAAGTGGERHGRRGAADADHHLQPRPARPGPRLPGARRRAYHGGRLSRQRRAHPARRHGGRPRPLGLEAARRLLLAARASAWRSTRCCRPSTAASGWSWPARASVPKALVTIAQAGLQAAVVGDVVGVEPGARLVRYKGELGL